MTLMDVRLRAHWRSAGVLVVGAMAWSGLAGAQDAVSASKLHRGNLVVSRSVYDNRASNVAVGADTATWLHEYGWLCGRDGRAL